MKAVALTIALGIVACQSAPPCPPAPKPAPASPAPPSRTPRRPETPPHSSAVADPWLSTLLAELALDFDAWAAPRKDCVGTDACQVRGQCSRDLEAGACVAKTHTDCLMSLDCRFSSRCAPHAGRCVSPAFRETSRPFHFHREMTPLLMGLALETAGAFRGSRELANPSRSRRRATILGGNIVDCRHGEACYRFGQCAFKAGRCEVRPFFCNTVVDIDARQACERGEAP